MTPDHINGAFELGAAAFMSLSVRRLWLDREIKGFSMWPTVFFTSMGLWNLFYYPSLDQLFSFAGGCAVVTVNTCYLALIWKVHRDSRRRTLERS